MKLRRPIRSNPEERVVRAFITGISGFVGGHLASILANLGDQVAGVSREGCWPADLEEPMRNAGIPPPLAWDIADAPSAAVRRFVADFRPDVVYHLAALSIPEDCGGGGVPSPEALAINVEGTLRVARLVAELSRDTSAEEADGATSSSGSSTGNATSRGAAVEPSVATAGVPTATTRRRPRLIFASSSHVYGAVEPGRAVVNEFAPLCGSSAYALTKRMAEERLLAEAAAGTLDVVIVRAFKHAGTRQDRRLMLAEWATQFAAGVEPVRIRCCDSWLDITDVRDMCVAYRLLAERGVNGRIYNVGSGVARRTGDIFLRFRALARPGCDYVETHPGPRYEPIADTALIRSDTGWSPALTLDDTLRAIWQAQVGREASPSDA
jgi:GDP-4-dehydro-6-deoxy-D-mannose reductase